MFIFQYLLSTSRRLTSGLGGICRICKQSHFLFLKILKIVYLTIFFKAYERAKIKETVINSDTQTDTTESSKQNTKIVLLKRFLTYVLFMCVFVASIYSNQIEISDDITYNTTTFITLHNQTLYQNSSSNVNRMIWYF